MSIILIISSLISVNAFSKDITLYCGLDAVGCEGSSKFFHELKISGSKFYLKHHYEDSRDPNQATYQFESDSFDASKPIPKKIFVKLKSAQGKEQGNNQFGLWQGGGFEIELKCKTSSWEKCELIVADSRTQWKKQEQVNKETADIGPVDPKGHKWDPVSCSLKAYKKYRATQKDCDSIGE